MRMKRLKLGALKPLTIAGLAMACLPSLAYANVIVNGSFEDPSVPFGSWDIQLSISGWTTTFGSGVEIQNHVAGTPFDGDQLAELDSTGNSGIQQVVATDPGLYSLSFQYSPRPGVSSSSAGIEVYFNGSLLDSISADGTGNGDTVWTLHQYSVSTGSSTTIEFRAVGDSDFVGGYLDDVRLTAVVPEPVHAASLVGIGLGALALGRGLRHRRKS